MNKMNTDNRPSIYMYSLCTTQTELHYDKGSEKTGSGGRRKPSTQRKPI